MTTIIFFTTVKCKTGSTIFNKQAECFTFSNKKRRYFNGVLFFPASFKIITPFFIEVPFMPYI